MRRTTVLLLSAGFLVGLATEVRADGLIANWKLNEPAGSTSFADSSGNGNTGTLYGTDTLTTIAGPYGASGPTALDFNGVAGDLGNSGTADSGTAINNPTPSYIGVPYNAALSNQILGGAPVLGLWNLTISVWIYLPSNFSGSTPGSEIVSYYPPGPQGSTAGQVYQLGDAYQSGNSNRKMYFADGLMAGTAYDTYFSNANSGGVRNATPGQWQLITATYYGSATNANPVCTLYENGVCIQSNDATSGPPNSGSALPPALTPAQSIAAIGMAAYSTLYIGNGWGTRDNEWIGGLSDIGIWNVCLTGAPPNPSNNVGIAGTSGGETAALYNAPTSGIAALQQYGVSAMDKLFTLYDGKLAAPMTVTTGNSTLTWKYVAGGLTGASGGVGQLTGNGYYVLLNSAGGGVETVLPGDANLDGRVDINDLTIVLSNFGKTTGMSWTTGEFAGDGTVDINDLTIVLAHFGQSVGSSLGSLAAVPEPGSAALLAGIGLAAMFGWRRLS